MKLKSIVKVGCISALILASSVTVAKQPFFVSASTGVMSWKVADDIRTVPVVLQNASPTETAGTTSSPSSTTSSTKQTTAKTTKTTVVKHVADVKVPEVGTDFNSIDKDTLSGMFNDNTSSGTTSGKTTAGTTKKPGSTTGSTTTKAATTTKTTTTVAPTTTTPPLTDSRLKTGKIAESLFMSHIRVKNTTTGTVYDGSSRQSLQLAIALDVKMEMGTSLFAEKSTEAWKAQAVASYTYLLRYCWSGATYAFALSSDINLNNSLDKRIYDAVGEVLGVKLLDVTQTDAYKSLCLTTYYAASAGVSSDSGKVWVTQLPYLKSVSSPYETDAIIRHYTGGYMGLTSTYTTTYTDVMAKLEAKYGEVYADTEAGKPCIYATEWDGGVGKYVAKTNLYYYKSGVKTYITGPNFRTVIGHIRSHAFTVTQSGDNLTFTVLGYGHGVGMSQMGAVGYANEAGWDYIQILQHYYSVTSSSSQQLVKPLW